MSAEKESLLDALAGHLASNPGLSVERGRKTDLEIASVLADANWQVGKKKVQYSACLLADEQTRTVKFWEMIKESGGGLGAFFSFKTESYRTDGKTISGNVKETAYGPTGKVIDYNWDYSRLRGEIESLVKAKGWKFKTVLLKGSAMY